MKPFKKIRIDFINKFNENTSINDRLILKSFGEVLDETSVIQNWGNPKKRIIQLQETESPYDNIFDAYVKGWDDQIENYLIVHVNDVLLHFDFILIILKKWLVYENNPTDVLNYIKKIK